MSIHFFENVLSLFSNQNLSLHYIIIFFTFITKILRVKSRVKSYLQSGSLLYRFGKNLIFDCLKKIIKFISSKLMRYL